MEPRVSDADRPKQAQAFLYGAWVLAFVAALGSLFFGEVMGLPICTLCWYQRIFLYPLVLMLPAAILLRDRNITYYALPLAVSGLALAAYHNLLYYGFIARSITPCTEAVPCTLRQIEWLGFITIPLMSVGAFGSILACLVGYATKSRRAA
jgi:disulfide bond formation protein DsbB